MMYAKKNGCQKKAIQPKKQASLYDAVDDGVQPTRFFNERAARNSASLHVQTPQAFGHRTDRRCLTNLVEVEVRHNTNGQCSS